MKSYASICQVCNLVTDSRLLELICLQNRIFVTSGKSPKPLQIPLSSHCHMFMIMSGNCAGAKSSKRKLRKCNCLQQTRLLSPTEGSVELKHVDGKDNESYREEAGVVTVEYEICKAKVGCILYKYRPVYNVM